MKEVCVVKYGGSFLIPKDEYEPEAILFLIDLVKQFPSKHFIFVIGGGGLARKLVASGANAVHKVLPENLTEYGYDELGIAATRMNAKVVLDTMTEILGEKIVDQEICLDPDGPLSLAKRVRIAAGGRPGHTTDYDMMLLAKNAAAMTVCKITDFQKVLNVAPKEYEKEKEYEELSSLSWKEFQELVGEEYHSGGHYPLDPRAVVVGTEIAHKHNDFKLFIGKKESLPQMIAGEKFEGTTICDVSTSS